MTDPNIIATLIPCERNKAAQVAFCLPGNHRWYMQPNSTISGRGATSRPTDSKPSTNFPQLQLTFSEEPKVPREGYSFGTNPHGDVLLGEKSRKHNISHRHFCITFDNRRRLILRDSSRWGTAVSYGGLGKAEVRKHFTWILDLEKGGPDTTKEVAVKINELSFRIRIPDHADCQSEYDHNVEVFLRKDRVNLLKLNGLGIDSIKKTPFSSGTSSCDQGPIYIGSESLGSGSFGNVVKVRDVSTGGIYARKTFKPPQRQVDATTWLKRIKNETKIMMENEHEHIMPIVHHTLEPEPSLVMPYYPLGSLCDQHLKISFSRKETVDILLQILKGLAHLHRRNVAHRDLKPDNILVELRKPYIRIRIADFGLAKIEEGTKLRSGCGTERYMAPELSISTPNYKPSVDLWSAGLIILEYEYNFQDQTSKTGSWCQHICNYANDRARGLDPLIKILKTGMLKVDPKERLSAVDCLRRVGRDVLNNHILDKGVITRTRKTALRDEVVDTNGAKTAISGVLRVEKASIFGSNVSPRRFSKIPITKMALQDKVSGSTVPTTTITGVFRDQQTSNPGDAGNPGRFSETKLQKTDLQNQATDSNGSTSTITGVFRYQKTSDSEEDSSHGRFSERQLQKTDLQNEVTESNGPTTSVTGARQGQETSNFEFSASLGRGVEEKDGTSNKKLAECPITNGGKGYKKRRRKPTRSSSDRDLKRQRTTASPTRPSKCHDEQITANKFLERR